MLILGVLCTIVFFLADGHADGIYLKLTTPKQSSLILGTSKASQGLHPAVFNKILDRNDIYNYSFTVVHSPYGPVYYNLINKKLRKDNVEKDGVFIVSVDSYSVSSSNEFPNDSVQFRENELVTGRIKKVTGFPNFEYLLLNYELPYIYLLTRKLDYVSQGVMHDDGWLETNYNTNSNVLKNKTKEKIEIYRERHKTYHFSDVRFSYLEKTIKLLKQFGTVYIVRLPVLKELSNFEDEVVPNFDDKIKKLAIKNEIIYYNMKNYSNNFKLYVDGNHLNPKAGKIFSEVLADKIKKSQDSIAVIH